jgi:hypothetical protein
MASARDARFGVHHNAAGAVLDTRAEAAYQAIVKRRFTPFVRCCEQRGSGYAQLDRSAHVPVNFDLQER